MNVSLTKELESFIDDLVKSGMYFSASEVVRDGLRLLKEQQAIKKLRYEELKAEIMLEVEDLRMGKAETFSSGDEVFEEIVKRGKKKLTEKRSGNE